MLDTNKMIDELLKSIGDKLHNNPELFLIDPTSSANSDFRYSKEGLVNRKAVSIGLLQLLIAQRMKLIIFMICWKMIHQKKLLNGL